MRVIFAGTPEFAVPSLRSLLVSQHQVCAVYTQPDRPFGRGQKLKPSPIKELAMQAGIQVLQPISLKTSDELHTLASFDADLMVVVAYGMILPQTALDLPKLGCINVHASLLPRWRGAAPIQRAILAGDEKTGVTIMQMELKLDAGDMLLTEECAIEPNDTASSLHDKLAVLGAIGLSKVLTQLEQGHLKPEKQDEALVTYAEKLTKHEAVIDWTQPAELIERKIRGLNAWPVAQTLYQGEALRIWQAHVVQGKAHLLPGTVRVQHKQVEVATSQGWLRLLEVQLPGGKRLPSQAFLNAHTVNGVRLGV